MEKKLFIGIPIYAAVDPHFFRSFLSLIDNGVPCTYQTLINESLITRARNTITQKFLESKCSHLLMIDSDLKFSPQNVLKMLTHNVDIVGGTYFLKNPNQLRPCLNEVMQEKPDKNGLLEVGYVGTGFMMIARRVFERMIEKWGDQIRYTPDGKPGATEYNFWHADVYQYPDGSRRYLSEDWWFCQRARDLGVRIFADASIVLEHSGNALYPLPHQRQVATTT